MSIWNLSFGVYYQYIPCGQQKDKCYYSAIIKENVEDKKQNN